MIRGACPLLSLLTDEISDFLFARGTRVLQCALCAGGEQIAVAKHACWQTTPDMTKQYTCAQTFRGLQQVASSSAGGGGGGG